jgi:GntR family transcriptional regulator
VVAAGGGGVRRERPGGRKWPAVTEAVRGRIGDGTLKPGAVVSIAGLGPEFGVARKTVARGLVGLVTEGLLDRRRGVGYVVRDPGPPG